MTLPKKLRTHISVVKRSVLLSLTKLLPMHTKRLVFWGSLYGAVCEKRNIKGATAERINALLGLAVDGRAAHLPIKLNDVLWDESPTCVTAIADALQGKPIAQCFREFVEGIPASLRYASERFIQDDFENVVSAHRSPISANA